MQTRREIWHGMTDKRAGDPRALKAVTGRRPFSGAVSKGPVASRLAVSLPPRERDEYRQLALVTWNGGSMDGREECISVSRLHLWHPAHVVARFGSLRRWISGILIRFSSQGRDFQTYHQTQGARNERLQVRLHQQRPAD